MIKWSYHAFLRRLNAAEMYVDIGSTAEGMSTNWVAESGVLDLFFLLGPKPAQVGHHTVLLELPEPHAWVLTATSPWTGFGAVR